MFFLPPQDDGPPLTRSTNSVFTPLSPPLFSWFSVGGTKFIVMICVWGREKKHNRKCHRYLTDLDGHSYVEYRKDRKVALDCLHRMIFLKSVLSWPELKSWQLIDKSQEKGNLLSTSQSPLTHEEPSVTGLDLLTPSLPLCFHKCPIIAFLSGPHRPTLQ